MFLIIEGKTQLVKSIFPEALIGLKQIKTSIYNITEFVSKSCFSRCFVGCRTWESQEPEFAMNFLKSD